MTLDEVLAIGTNELDCYEPFNVSPQNRRIEPIVEKASIVLGDSFHEATVRQMVRNVLAGLKALPGGTWTTQPQSMILGGVEQRVIQKNHIALVFRLQYDPNNHGTVLLVGGGIVDAKEKTMAGR
jgi:hypothetical protein